MPTSIPIPQIKFGKRKDRSQMTELFTHDDRIEIVELPVLLFSMTDEQHHMTYLIDADNQYLDDDGTWHQIVSEKSQIPICMRKQNDLTEDEQRKVADTLYTLSRKQKEYEILSQIKQGGQWNRLTWIVSIVMGAMLLIATITTLGG